MVLGVYHMANPGLDVNNVHVEPVTTPAKQAQIAAVVERLADFRPTAVALERVASDQRTLLDPRYPSFTPADLLHDANERVQIGYRLAHTLGLERVYAIDEQPGPGRPDYFPYGAVQAWADSHGERGQLASVNATARAWGGKFEAAQRTFTAAQLLWSINTPGTDLWFDQQRDYYYRLLGFGDGEDLVGADLNGRWYTRNARIFAKLMRVAVPGDRLVIVFGFGHGYWLRHFAATAPGFALVEPGPYLRPSSGARRRALAALRKPV